MKVISKSPVQAFQYKSIKDFPRLIEFLKNQGSGIQWSIKAETELANFVSEVEEPIKVSIQAINENQKYSFFQIWTDFWVVIHQSDYPFLDTIHPSDFERNYEVR